MRVSLVIWRLLVGCFNGSKLLPHKEILSHNSAGINHHFRLITILILLILDGIHPNPGPQKSKDHNFSVFFWNLNSLPVNFFKLSLLSTYNCIYQYDLICLSETFLDSSISSNDERLSLEGYDMIRVDHPNNVKRGGVCVYIKNSLATRICNISNLNECIVVELNINNKKGYVIL